MSEGASPDPSAGGESAAEIDARRRGDPYLLYEDDHGREHVVSLPGTWQKAAVGRSPHLDIVLTWDTAVSTIHATFERLGDDWLLVDDGLSRNGSFVNGERVTGRRRLRDGDEMRFGSTTVGFRSPYQLGQETVIRPAPEHEPGGG